ncbi:MAG: hypothetical protein R3357_14735, partial [Burkholderiales bacterium]|nr:hypothetical protein [Burkholderiales bacterium]
MYRITGSSGLRARQLEPGHLRHRLVGHHRVHAPGVAHEPLFGVERIALDLDLEAPALEQLGHEIGDHALVVDEQHAPAQLAGGPVGARRRRVRGLAGRRVERRPRDGGRRYAPGARVDPPVAAGRV